MPCRWLIFLFACWIPFILSSIDNNRSEKVDNLPVIMGKRSKKKTSKSSSSPQQQQAKKHQSGSSKSPKGGDKEEAKLDSEHKSLYLLYKQSTQAVIQWGKDTYHRQNGNHKSSTSKGRNSPIMSHDDTSLRQVIFDILGSLATDGIVMPVSVSRDLEIAISYRQKVQGFYQALPQVSQEDYQRHQWIIYQLQKLQKRFLINQQRQQQQHKKTTVQYTINVARVVYKEPSDMAQQGYEALAISDDEDDDEDSVGKPENHVPVGGDSHIDNEQPKKGLPTTALPTTDDTAAAEEKHFALALFLYEVDTIRQNLRQRWQKWADEYRKDDNDKDKAKKLLAVTASTEYALKTLRSSFLQRSVEAYNEHDDLETVMKSMLANDRCDLPTVSAQTKHSLEDFQEGDLVTIVGLVKRPDLNGRHGRIVSGQQEIESKKGSPNRLRVQLFPSTTAESNEQDSRFALQPKNLILSDTTVKRLCEIYNGLDGAVGDLGSMVVPPWTAGETFSDSSKRRMEALGCFLFERIDFIESAKNQDFEALLRMIFESFFPKWVSLSFYLPEKVFGNGIFLSSVLDFFHTNGEVRFILAVSLLVVIDGAIIAFSTELEGIGPSGIPGDTVNSSFQSLNNALDTSLYDSAKALDERGGKPASKTFDLILEVKMILVIEHTICAVFFPFISGEILLGVLGLHYVFASSSVYVYAPRYLHILHTYWVLRVGGYLGRIPNLESVVALFPQRLFFRGGLAKKGQNKHLVCHQLAQGMDPKYSHICDGRTFVPEHKRPRKPVYYKQTSETYQGLQSYTCARMMNILQWRGSNSFAEIDEALDEIESIAHTKVDMCLAPLLQVYLCITKLADTLESDQMVSCAWESLKRMGDGAGMEKVASAFKPIHKVSFWAMLLSDGRFSFPGNEKDEMLCMLASNFEEAFADHVVEPVDPGDEPTLTFNEEKLLLDPSLWTGGRKAAKKMERMFL